MKEKEFDAMFRSKIETDDASPNWDEAKVWEKIKPIQAKKRVAFWPYAASLAMLVGGAVYVLFLSKKEVVSMPVLSDNSKSILDKNKLKYVDNQIVKIKINSQIVNEKSKNKLRRVCNSTRNISKSLRLFNTFSGQLQTAHSRQIIHSQQNQDSEIVLKNESSTKIVLQEDKKPVQIPDFEQENKSLEKGIITRLEPKDETIKHTIVLNIPIENEDKSVRKKRVIGRFFQQVNRYSNGEKFDWEEVNIRPKAIWTYLKNSFTADSTVHL